MAAYTAEFFRKNDHIITENGISFVVASPGVAGQKQVTAREILGRRENGRLKVSSRFLRVDVAAIALCSPAGAYDGVAVKDIVGGPRYEMSPTGLGISVEGATVAVVDEVEGFRLRSESVYRMGMAQGRMF